MFPPVFKGFLFCKSSAGFVLLGIFRYSPNTWSNSLQEGHMWRTSSLGIKFGAIQTDVLPSLGLSFPSRWASPSNWKQDDQISRIKAKVHGGSEEVNLSGFKSRHVHLSWMKTMNRASKFVLDDLLWMMTRAWLRLVYLEPAHKQCKGCVCDWGHSEWIVPLVAPEDTLKKWSVQRNLPCEQSPEPRVSCSIYYISSQESTLFLVRKLLLGHTSVLYFTESSIQQWT